MGIGNFYIIWYIMSLRGNLANYIFGEINIKRNSDSFRINFYYQIILYVHIVAATMLHVVTKVTKAFKQYRSNFVLFVLVT